MEISKYKELSVDDKASLLWENGSFVEDRVQYNKYKVCTYSLYNFYVEVFYDISNNKIKRITALETESEWHGYLSSINLNYLLR